MPSSWFLNHDLGIHRSSDARRAKDPNEKENIKRITKLGNLFRHWPVVHNSVRSNHLLSCGIRINDARNRCSNKLVVLIRIFSLSSIEKEERLKIQICINCKPVLD